MRKLLNTLYVTNPEVYLTKDGENIVAKIEQKEVMRIPVLNLEDIVCFGYAGASPRLMAMCAERNIGMCFLTPSGHFLARVIGGVNGNVLLRRIQYRHADDAQWSLNLSKTMIAGKIFNSRKVLDRFRRDHTTLIKDLENYQKTSVLLDNDRKNALSCSSIDKLRGLEGDAANAYFSLFNQMITNRDNIFAFHGRNRRPPKDPVNCLLSFSYTLLAQEVQSALETVGLDPYVGFMHTDRPGRASLALDMMEEFRAYLGDRFVLSLVNRGQVSARDFIENGQDNVIMTDSCRKTVISAWQKRKKESLTHPFLKETVQIGLLPYIQAILLARYIRGNLDGYPVFLIQ
ncbi:MAG: type I-C CRISPR-associated endonuclease Cas1c [Prevotellaceae bacterium]|nr:type I-C CRISPR-associated endonuclease Cas1c [Prevotellaceae bacterium]